MGGTGVDWKTIFGVLGLLVLFSLLNRCESNRKMEREGIVRSVKTDTVVVDTVYLNEGISLPVERLRYSKEN